MKQTQLTKRFDFNIARQYILSVLFPVKITTKLFIKLKISRHITDLDEQLKHILKF